ncbi:hypothetical protein HMPREF9238_01607 [Gleimia europaea ACS-120-V-Col10b]|uniref:Uncharacterized protein n=1 Tax=Gleimia europaea ACS-120-V-Col10b TaxID=883069 RepID=A0A9W5RCY6_9ACTO|nr:hypothetical protein HMPREF9238_01607 [Gleimia europaea ACS-120-V-Col10b]
MGDSQMGIPHYYGILSKSLKVRQVTRSEFDSAVVA